MVSVAGVPVGQTKSSEQSAKKLLFIIVFAQCFFIGYNNFVSRYSGDEDSKPLHRTKRIALRCKKLQLILVGGW